MTRYGSQSARRGRTRQAPTFVRRAAYRALVALLMYGAGWLVLAVHPPVLILHMT